MVHLPLEFVGDGVLILRRGQTRGHRGRRDAARVGLIHDAGADIELILVANETEALILEQASWIKRHVACA